MMEFFTSLFAIVGLALICFTFIAPSKRWNMNALLFMLSGISFVAVTIGLAHFVPGNDDNNFVRFNIVAWAIIFGISLLEAIKLKLTDK